MMMMTMMQGWKMIMASKNLGFSVKNPLKTSKVLNLGF